MAASAQELSVLLHRGEEVCDSQGRKPGWWRRSIRTIPVAEPAQAKSASVAWSAAFAFATKDSVWPS